MTVMGYARVSTVEQALDPERDMPQEVAVDCLYRDKTSRKKEDNRYDGHLSAVASRLFRRNELSQPAPR